MSKRPWEERMYSRGAAGGGAGQENLWSGSFLPQLDAIPYTRPQIPRTTAIADRGRYDAEHSEMMSKRPRYSASSGEATAQDHRYSPSKMVINAIRSPMYGAEQTTTTEASNYPPTKSENMHTQNRQDQSGLCQRCRRSLREMADFTNSGSAQESCEICCKSPELAYVTQAAAAGLSQLAETLRSGMSSGRRGVVQGPEQRRIGSADCPPIAQFGLKLTLNWLLGKINYVNELADQYVQRGPLDPGTNFNVDPEKPGPSYAQDGASDMMKRRYNSSTDEFGQVDAADDSAAPADANNPKRRSLAPGLSGPDSLPPMRSQASYYASTNSSDPMAHRSSNLQQATAQNRQLPSPPGRSLTSPTTLNFQASSSSVYGSSQSSGLPPATTLQQNNVSNVLPPISVAQSSDSALQAHTAALQHEVSVQKIALSSLQSEHDKLLAAFLRSQTRASALEKKHAVSDGEIISLTEEKLRLQGQVQELEKDVEELARSRDEFRQAAVQEGAQYIEIVKKATRLEEIASEERKNWSRIKADMERRIEALKAGRPIPDEPVSSTDAPRSGTPLGREPVAAVDTATAQRSESTPVVKLEQLAHELQLSRPGPQRLLTDSDSEKALQAEIRRLQQRCVEIEDALRAVAEEGRSMESTADKLKIVGKSILERVSVVLKGDESTASGT
ncbi:hypothetical protein B7463_g10130, partial [Scytalidium lignicola]